MPEVTINTDSWSQIMALNGLGTPARRATLALAASSVLLYAARMPSMCFDEENGRLLPWRPLSNAPGATPVHFLAFPLVLSAACYLFV